VASGILKDPSGIVIDPSGILIQSSGFSPTISFIFEMTFSFNMYSTESSSYGFTMAIENAIKIIQKHIEYTIIMFFVSFGLYAFKINPINPK